WSRGVDTALFRPRDKSFLPDPRPISMYVGRVAVEKNLEAFLTLDLPGTKYVVCDGPQLGELRMRYPEVRFTGARQARNSHGISPPPTCSSFPASPTRSASSCWRRSLAVCRLRPSRCGDRSTSWGRRRSERWTLISALPSGER